MYTRPPRTESDPSLYCPFPFSLPYCPSFTPCHPTIHTSVLFHAFFYFLTNITDKKKKNVRTSRILPVVTGLASCVILHSLTCKRAVMNMQPPKSLSQNTLNVASSTCWSSQEYSVHICWRPHRLLPNTVTSILLTLPALQGGTKAQRSRMSLAGTS